MIARIMPGLVALALMMGAGGPLAAQMLLQGANNGVPPGAPPKEAGGPSEGPTVVRPVAMKPPSEDTIVGRPLSRDGKSGLMMFDRVGADIALTKLKFDGDKISQPQETCSLDVSLSTPIVATPAGRPTGTLRFDVPLEICPFTIDILDGAALVSRADPTCDVKAADCRVTPGGLWGPAAIDISSTKAADLERQRIRIETTMRTNFKALLKKAGRDRVAVKAIAREQAAFSSQREMTCRDYDQEAIHGFCSTQITEARALELLAKFGAQDDTSSPRKHPARAQPREPLAGAADLRPTTSPTPAPSPPAPGAAIPASSQTVKPVPGGMPAMAPQIELMTAPKENGAAQK